MGNLTMAKKSNIFLIPLLLLCCSCATLFNLPEENISFIVNEPVIINVDKFHSDTTSDNLSLIVARSKKPLKVSVSNSQSTKNYNIKSHSSIAYWLNIYPAPFCIGFLVDMHNPKRYTYPRSIYINTNDSSGIYHTYKPLDSVTAKRNNIIKFTPFRIFAFSNPGVELSYERKTGSHFSTELMATYLLPTNILANEDLNARGYRFGAEEKFYLNNQAPVGPYLGFGINHLNTHYNIIENFGPEGINSPHNNPLNYSDSISIYKRTTDFNFTFGYQDLAGRVTFDYYIGIGIRNRNVIHGNRINPDDVMVSPIDLNFNYLNNVEGKNTTAIFLLGVKVGWLF
jgi:hypothetical protein